MKLKKREMFTPNGHHVAQYGCILQLLQSAQEYHRHHQYKGEVLHQVHTPMDEQSSMFIMEHRHQDTQQGTMRLSGSERQRRAGQEAFSYFFVSGDCFCSASLPLS